MEINNSKNMVNVKFYNQQKMFFKVKEKLALSALQR